MCSYCSSGSAYSSNENYSAIGGGISSSYYHAGNTHEAGSSGSRKCGEFCTDCGMCR